MLAATASTNAQITIDNFEPGELVRYPLVLLRGHASGDSVAAGRDWSTARRFPVVDRTFCAPVQLVDGINMVVLQSGRYTFKYRLDYRPSTNPLRVLCAAVPSGQGGPRDSERSAALKLVQSLFAEAMHDAGYGHKTFSLEFDRQGQVVIRHEAGLPERDRQIYVPWNHICDIVAGQVPAAAAPASAVRDALERGSMNATYTGVSMNWPSRWDAFAAARLNWNPFFQPDRVPAAKAESPKITIRGDSAIISAPAGIRVWGAERDGVTPFFKEIPGSSPPKEVTTSIKELRLRLMTQSAIRLTVVDADGRIATLELA